MRRSQVGQVTLKVVDRNGFGTRVSPFLRRTKKAVKVCVKSIVLIRVSCNMASGHQYNVDIFDHLLTISSITVVYSIVFNFIL